MDEQQEENDRPLALSSGTSRSTMEDVVSMIIFESCLPWSFTQEMFNPFTKGSTIICGSHAEFSIRPIPTCVGDIDILFYHPGEIAFSEDVPSLPADVRNCDDVIKCFRMEPYEKYSGFLRMKYVGYVKYDWNLNKYEFCEARKTAQQFDKMNQQWYKDQFLSHEDDKVKLQVKGPAINYTRRSMNQDIVLSVYCPRWPTEANDWFYRPRYHGWPTKANLQIIANMGCHVVNAQHRDCRDDEYQWRLSFSLAEVVLLKSWTKTQQLLYHMLRFFAKKELIQKECPKEKEVLCTYHLKTLMLWTCEQESPEWWNSSLIEVCSKLLQKLSKWLRQRYCRNYFIPDANLFHEQFDLNIYEANAECIQSLSRPEILSHWFLLNYFLPFCIGKGFSGHEFCDISLPKLYATAERITFENKYAILSSFDMNLCLITIAYTLRMNDMHFWQKVEQCTDEWDQNLYIARRLPLKSEDCSIYVISLACLLRTACAILFKTVSCYKTLLSNIMMILLRHFTSCWPKCNNFPNNYEKRFNKTYVDFLRAQEYLGEMPVSVSDPEFQLLSRLSMEFLRKSVKSNDATSMAIRSAALAYMAAICFVTSKYETAVELCSEMLTQPEHVISSRLSSSKREPLSAGCLMFIDDVSNIVGFLLLSIHVRDALLDRYSEVSLDLRLTPEVFAQYIMIQSMQRISAPLIESWIRISGEFLMDELFMSVVKRKMTRAKRCWLSNKLCVYRRSSSISELINHVTGFSLDEEISIRLLMECSLKKLTSLYEVVCNRGFSCNTLAFCCRMLYHYRCRHYDEVMTLCEQILREPDIGTDLNKDIFPDVMVLSFFCLYFDEEVQCLIGLQSLCLVLFPLPADPKRSHEFHTFFYRVFHSLFHSIDSLCLYSLGRHFLARYLQFRCLMDSNRSVSEVLSAFDKLKSKLPFECIVHEFFRQKLNKSVKPIE